MVPQTVNTPTMLHIIALTSGSNNVHCPPTLMLLLCWVRTHTSISSLLDGCGLTFLQDGRLQRAKVRVEDEEYD